MQDLLHDDGQFFKAHFASYSGDSKIITCAEFMRFLEAEQGERRACEGEAGRQLLKVDVSKRIMSYLQDSSRHVQEPWFRVPEFVDWLFSRENQASREMSDETIFHTMPYVFGELLNQFTWTFHFSYSTRRRTGRFART